MPPEGSDSGARGPSPHDEWATLEPLIDALLDVAPGQRAALITELSGGDVALQSRLVQLLAECEQPHALLDGPLESSFAGLMREDPAAFPPSLAERYQDARELGRGGMAVVFRARDAKHGRDVAVKVVRTERADELGRDRFLREIDIIAGLRHPHIVPLYDSGDADGSLYFVMPYEEGLSLRERIVRDGPMPIREATIILRGICDALGYAHKRYFVVCESWNPRGELVASPRFTKSPPETRHSRGSNGRAQGLACEQLRSAGRWRGRAGFQKASVGKDHGRLHLSRGNRPVRPEQAVLFGRRDDGETIPFIEVDI